MFLRFYEFHLKYRSHPGGVYCIFPELRRHFELNEEDTLWLAFIMSRCENIVTAWIIFRRFPSFDADPEDVQQFISDHWHALEWDTDRRHVKSKVGDALRGYQAMVGASQGVYFRQLCASDDPVVNFRRCWDAVISLPYFGIRSTFSFIGYLRIVLPQKIESNSLFIEQSGSKSIRHGLLTVLGREDITTHTSDVIEWLRKEADLLVQECRTRFAGRDFERDVSLFTFASALCCYKGWHRPNRRYPNVYMDKLHDQILKATARYPDVDLSVFWTIRKRCLPRALRVEDTPDDCGLTPKKQNHYLETGEVIMMDIEWPCFRNSFNST